MRNSAGYHCRVCGLHQLTHPWGEDGKCPTYEICDCCGVEFGYEDITLIGIEIARSKWLANGAKWFSPEARPLGWDYKKQLLMVPLEFR